VVGDSLGGEPTDFMADIGFETYQREILDEAIRGPEKRIDLFRECKAQKESSKQDDFVGGAAPLIRILNS